MGLFDSIFGGGLYSLSSGDRRKMTAKKGFIRYAFSYLGGHRRFPEVCNIVAELSVAGSLNPVLNVYTNRSPAGFSPDPKEPMFALPMNLITRVANDNKNEFAGGLMIDGLGAILQETRYLLTIDYVTTRGVNQTIRFGSTAAVKSEPYFKEFVKHLADCLEQRDTTAVVPEQTVASDGDITTQLERLNALRQQGALTEEEFSNAKTKLLGNS